nr:translation initiation factor IF-2 subunit beta [Candidatus Sigynarchaeota archaeon]
MDDAEYQKLLDHGLGQLPEDAMQHDRFVIPEALVLVEGNKTIIKNFKAIVEKFERDSKHFFKFLVNEVGTAGSVDEQAGRALLTGSFSKKIITDTVENYAKEFVICKTCGKPDTIIDKQGRQNVLVCHACGARQAVQKM